MGIDPDAYMAGAIPSLNRGGSWQPDDRHAGSQYQSVQGPGSGGSIFPRSSQIVPPGAVAAGGMTLNMGNRSNFHPFHANVNTTPWSGMGYQPLISPTIGPASIMSDGKMNAVGSRTQSSAGAGRKASVRPTMELDLAGNLSQAGGSMVSGRAPSVRPTKHPGWANLHGGGYRSSPTSPTTPLGAAILADHVSSQYGVHKLPTKVGSVHPQGHVREALSSPKAFMEPVWEWNSGSPKPMTAEPDYFSLPLGESASISASVSGPPSPSAPQTPRTPRTPSGNRFESLPPPPRRPATQTMSTLPQSPRPRADSHRVVRPSGPARRHTHDRFSPKTEPVMDKPSRGMKLDSKSLGRVRVKSGLSRATFDAGSVGGDSYYAPSTKTYQQSQSLDSPSSASGRTDSTATGISALSQASPRPGNPRRSTASTYASSPLTGSGTHRSFAEKRFKNRSHPALSTIASTATHNQTVPSSATTATPLKVRSQHPSMDLRSLHDALPSPGSRAGTDQSTPPQTAPLPGYVLPLSDDGYDRYTAHPAAPVSLRADTNSDTISNLNRPPRGAGLKHVTADTYRPPGFPKPLKDIEWNRDGPAMRTYGIAWLREAEADTLPGRPAGPRWIQARPPASAVQSGGSWWESAG